MLIFDHNTHIKNKPIYKGHYIWWLQKIREWMMAKMGHNEEF
jgi:hypothetical protein